MKTRTFEIHRDVDHTGLSGTGIVADGCVFPDGTTVVRWRELDTEAENYKRGVRATTVVFPDVQAVEALHGHNGATRLVFADEQRKASNERRKGSNPHLHFNVGGKYINPPLNTVTEDPA